MDGPPTAGWESILCRNLSTGKGGLAEGACL